jgi:hypothetical protein
VRTLAKILVFGAIVNFFAFLIGVSLAGGSALSGRIEGGEHLLVERGRWTKVEPWVWRYVRAHEISVFVTHPLAMLGFGILAVTRRRRAPCGSAPAA